jgi:hypothetical protein
MDINLINVPKGGQDQLLKSFNDVTSPALVDVSWSADKSVVWVNINGVCVLRACRIGKLVVDNEEV